MSLPTSIEFAAALDTFAENIADKLGVTTERVTAAVLSAAESFELVHQAWLEHDDAIDFEDAADYDPEWEPSEVEPLDSDDYTGPGYDDLEDDQEIGQW